MSVLPKADRRGRIRSEVGIRPDGKRAKIQIGDRNTSPAEAARRLNLIRSMYGKLTARNGSDRWSLWALLIAQRIGHGLPTTEEQIIAEHGTAGAAGVIALIQSWGIPVVTGKGYQDGIQIQREQIEEIIAQAVQTEIARLKESTGPIVDAVQLPQNPMDFAEVATFHEAIDAYENHLKSTADVDAAGNLKNSTHTKLNNLKRIRERNQDFPLRLLDTPKWDQVVSVWRNRPTTKRGGRGKPSWCTDIIKLLFRMAEWIDHNPQFNWHKPRGFDDIDRKIIPLPEDNNGGAFQSIKKETYSPEELATILEYCNPLWRAIIALSVNCGFGQSELGQWPVQNISLQIAHPHASKIQWRTSDSDSWITGPRPKTGCYGEHLLWPEVAEAIRPLLDGRQVIPVTKGGEPLWRKYSKRPQAAIDNRWLKIRERILADNPDFPKLPFGTFRDTLPNILRQQYSDDIASLCLQHQTPGSDKLLECYANLPFAKLFQATEELREYFSPMLNVLTR